MTVCSYWEVQCKQTFAFFTAIPSLSSPQYITSPNQTNNTLACLCANMSIHDSRERGGAEECFLARTVVRLRKQLDELLDDGEPSLSLFVRTHQMSLFTRSRIPAPVIRIYGLMQQGVNADDRASLANLRCCHNMASSSACRHAIA